MEENQSKETIQKKKNSSLIRILLVIFALLLFALGNIISLRGKYLAIKEIDNNSLDIFFKNLKIEYSIFGINFIVIFIIFFITNLIIKKGLKPFFDDDKLELPKLPNKSIAFIIAIITSFFAKSILSEKFMLFSNIAWFGINDPVFNNDISYYMFIFPFIRELLVYSIEIIALNLIYIALYYVITFNVYLNGVDRDLLKKSLFFKQMVFNGLIIVLICSVYIWTNSQNILTR